MAADKEALQPLRWGRRFGNATLALLSRSGLVNVDDVTTLGSPPDERGYLFICFAERGRIVLEG